MNTWASLVRGIKYKHNMHDQLNLVSKLRIFQGRVPCTWLIFTCQRFVGIFKALKGFNFFRTPVTNKFIVMMQINSGNRYVRSWKSVNILYKNRRTPVTKQPVSSFTSLGVFNCWVNRFSTILPGHVNTVLYKSTCSGKFPHVLLGACPNLFSFS